MKLVLFFINNVIQCFLLIKIVGKCFVVFKDLFLLCDSTYVQFIPSPNRFLIRKTIKKRKVHESKGKEENSRNACTN